MVRLIIWTLTCILICIARPSSAGISAVAADAGLPDKYITAICRDNRGLMWIGTRQGLCMYDGYRFLPLRGVLQNGILITRLLYDEGVDALWIATDKGLFLVHCRTLRTVSMERPGWEALTDICPAPAGKLYACYKSGRIAEIDTGNNVRLLARLPQAGAVQDYVRRIEPDGADALSLQTEGRYTFYRLQLSTGKLLKEAADTLASGAFFRKTTGDLRFVVRADDVEVQPRISGGSKDHAPSAAAWKGISNTVDLHLIQSSGLLYVLGKPSVLHKIDLAHSKAEMIVSDVFSGRTFICFFFDPEGIIWIGTNKGLIKITEDKQLFSRLLVQEHPVSVRSIAEDERGRLYAGTYSGLFRSDDKGAHWQNISRQLPYALLNVAGSYVYFAGGDSSFYRIDKQTGRVETNFFRNETLRKSAWGAASTLAQDRDGLLWIATSDGLFTYSPESNLLSPWQAGKGLPDGTRVTYIRPARSGRLWLCTDRGLLELDRKLGVLALLGTTSKPALPTDRIQSVDEDAQGRLWICTVDKGISIVSADRSQVTVLRTEDGLSDNETYHLIRAGHRVWISTFNGLSTYNLQTRTFYNYYMADGLTINEFNHNAFLRDGAGRIYFGTINGLNAFYPDSIAGTGQAAGLFASGISKWDNSTGAFSGLPPADTGAPIVLRPFDHSLSFTLGLTNYHNPENNIFQYRLKGLFDDWVRLDGQQSLRLDGLAAGSYILEIAALDSRGTPARNRLRYRIDVRQAFYKSWWFYLGMSLLISGLLGAFFALRLQHVKRVQRLREQIASDLHDEVGSLLTRITMTSDNLRYSNNAEADRISKLEKIAGLSRTAASSMSDILWAIDARNDYTGNLADRMREHAEEMLLPAGVELHFDFSVSQRMSITSQLRQQLYLIYKEAVNNIVKHSSAAEVQVSYRHNESGFRLSIINDGYMIRERVSTKGQGLKNMTMRAERVHAHVVARGSDGHFEVIVTDR